MSNAHVQLDTLSTQIVEAMIASGQYSDVGQAVNALLHRYQRYMAWLERELALGEESGPAIPYSPTLLDDLELQALDDISSGNVNISPSVAPVAELLQP